jgi:hypothetical protein
MHPAIAMEWDSVREGRTPDKTPATWARSARWICSTCSHKWWASISERLNGRLCPCCNPKRRQTRADRVAAGTQPTVLNNVYDTAPCVAEEWHPTKNGSLKPSQVSAGSNLLVWWMCKTDTRHEWQAQPGNRIGRSSGCPVCAGLTAGPGANFAELYPELLSQWDFARNEIDPRTVRPGSNRSVWWTCQSGPDHSWEMSVVARTSAGKGCLCCSFLKLSVTNSVAAFPSTRALWAEDLNGCSATQAVAGGEKKRFWRCPNGPDHVWQAEPNRILAGRGCPFCAGKRPSVTNNLESLYPHIADELAEPSLKASDILAHSHKRLRWRCNIDASHTWEAVVKDRTLDTIGCPWCYTPNTSRREVELASELESVLGGCWNMRVTGASGKSWLCDFVSEDLRVIVEYDGNRWHMDRVERDTRKTRDLEVAGWLVLRVRERGLEPIGPIDITMPSQWSTRHMTREVVQRLIDNGRVPSDALDGYSKRKKPLGADLAEARLANVRRAQNERDKAAGRAPRQRRRRSAELVVS